MGLPEANNSPTTEQSEKWRGEFGRQYSERNRFSSAEFDETYRIKYGVTRTSLNVRFLGDIPRSVSILEVGCNLGNQLVLLHEMGFESLDGIEIHEEIVRNAQSRVPFARIAKGSALKIPFDDASFDLVFTSGLLIHISPEDLPTVMNEIHRCAKKWIWGFEYHSAETTEVPYRGQSALLWKADYVRLYTERFADLELIAQEKLKYLGSDNVDSMFLLRRK
jgi:pseudaminic acid biosynthesis-associated methylase